MFLQETYEIEDLWYYNTNTYSTTSTTLNIPLPSTPFSIEYIVKQGNTNNSVPYMDIGNSSNDRMLIGQYAKAGANGLIIYKSTSTTHAYGTNTTPNQENTIWFSYDGSNYNYKLNNGTVMTIPDASVTLAKLIHIEPCGTTSNYLKNIKVKAL